LKCSIGNKNLLLKISALIGIGGLRAKINTIRRHPSIILDIFGRRNWQEIEHIVHSLDEKEVSEFIASAKMNLTNQIVVDTNTTLNLNKLCLVEDFQNTELTQALIEIQKFSPIGLIHRKDWEWAMGILAMRRLGKLNKRCLAIGIGCGTEVIPFYLANKISHVYATDLYNAGDWKAAAPTDFPKNPKKYAPFPYRGDALTVMIMDGTRLEFPSETFDIAFSFSSIEHFGGKNHSGALKSVREMERVLKPGGIAVIATEYIINDKKHYEFFNHKTIFSDLINKLEFLRLVEPIDLRITAQTLDTILDFFTIDVNWDKFDEDFKRQHPLILLRARNILFTSIMLVFSKTDKL
jgi:SAM-dependent methyltransferase